MHRAKEEVSYWREMCEFICFVANKILHNNHLQLKDLEKFFLFCRQLKKTYIHHSNTSNLPNGHPKCFKVVECSSLRNFSHVFITYID